MESKEEFEKRIRVININRNENGNTSKRENTRNTNKELERWNSTRKAKEEAVRKSRRRGFKKKVAALIAAGTILGCAGGYYVIQNINEVEIEATSSEDALSEETEDMLEKYAKIFEEVDNGTYDYSDMSADKLQEMVDEVESLYSSVIKEKMSSLTGIDESEFKLKYYFDNSDGEEHTFIIAYDGSYKEMSWHNKPMVTIFKQTNTMSDQISDLIKNWKELDELNESIEEDIEDGKISYEKYMKKLEKYYTDIAEIKDCEFLIDKNGNITMAEIYQAQTQEETTQIARKEEEER